MHLSTQTALGIAWRCLRCGSYVLGPAKSFGNLSDAPEVPRGRLLRDKWYMRVLSIERVIRGLILLLAALATAKIKSSRGSFSTIIDQKLPLLKPFTKSLGWDIDRSWLIHTLRSIAGAKQHTLTLITLGLIGYACIQFAEALGLWMMSRWGEYLAVVATSLFIPLEIYEVIKSITVLKVIALIINICLVLYLLYSKRLFNVRGGYKAFQKEHQAANLLNMKSIADSQEPPK